MVSFDPSKTDISYSLRRYYVDTYQEQVFSTIHKSQSVLDLGGVRSAHRGNFRVTENQNRTALNIRSGRIDIQGDAKHVPLADEKFDVVLCTETLEHVIEPVKVLQEAWRVLKPGGCLVVTVPFLFRQHADPADYGRYTEWFWQFHLSQIGFERIEIEKQGLFFSVLVDMLRHWMTINLNAGGAAYQIRSRLYRCVVQALRKHALHFDAQPEHQTHSFFGAYPGGFGIRAYKAP